MHFGPSHFTDMYHSADPYFSPKGKGRAKEFFDYYLDCYKKTRAGGGLICLPSGNHDMERIAYYCDDIHIKLAYAFIMSMPGVPFVYYGDEIGMRYIEGLRSIEGGYSRTGSRTPMQWDSTKNAGFSSCDTGSLYIRQDERADRPTVETQMRDSGSILNELKRIIGVRKENEMLQESADFELLSYDEALVYRRTLDGESVTVAINPLDYDVEINFPHSEGKVIYSLGKEAHIKDGRLFVPALSATYLSDK